MTKAYSQIDLHDALYSAARSYPGGIVALAGRIVVRSSDDRPKPISPVVLRNKLQPDVTTHHVTLENFAEIIELLDATVPESADLAVDALLWRLGRLAMRLPAGDAPDADALLRQMLDVFHRDGELAKLINSALADDRIIDDRELDLIEKSIQQALEAMMTLCNEVREKHKRDRAARGGRR